MAVTRLGPHARRRLRQAHGHRRVRRRRHRPRAGAVGRSHRERVDRPIREPRHRDGAVEARSRDPTRRCGHRVEVDRRAAVRGGRSEADRRFAFGSGCGDARRRPGSRGRHGGGAARERRRARRAAAVRRRHRQPERMAEIGGSDDEAQAVAPGMSAQVLPSRSHRRQRYAKPVGEPAQPPFDATPASHLRAWSPDRRSGGLSKRRCGRHDAVLRRHRDFVGAGRVRAGDDRADPEAHVRIRQHVGAADCARDVGARRTRRVAALPPERNAGTVPIQWAGATFSCEPATSRPNTRRASGLNAIGAVARVPLRAWTNTPPG